MHSFMIEAYGVCIWKVSGSVPSFLFVTFLQNSVLPFHGQRGPMPKVVTKIKPSKIQCKIVKPVFKSLQNNNKFGAKGVVSERERDYHKESSLELQPIYSATLRGST